MAKHSPQAPPVISQAELEKVVPDAFKKADAEKIPHD